MAKQITVDFEDNTYTLEFTRKSVERLEQQGFNVSELESRPVTMLYMLFDGAFFAHHASIKREKRELIFDSLEDRGELLSALTEMLLETYETLAEGSDDREGKSAKMTKNW